MSLIENFHDAAMSLVQSAFRHVVLNQEERISGLSGNDHLMQIVTRTLRARSEGYEDKSLVSLDADSVEACAKMLAEYLWAEIIDDQALKEEVESQYGKSSCDVRWLNSVVDYARHYIFRDQEPEYRDVESEPNLTYELPRPEGDDLVIGLLGDWGTGEPVAQVVLEHLFNARPDLILHVGDIYYSGTWEECQSNFLDLIESARGSHERPIPVYTIPGNHDYYSGGKGFYRLIDELNASLDQGPQGASFFNLMNDRWQLQAMDTGFYDHNLFDVRDSITWLHASEATWHRQQIREGVDAGRRVILFSHHQLFSALENVGKISEGNQDGANFNPYLLEAFRDHLDAGHVSAWFWGHEHVLGIYHPYLSLERGRCIGYSAFPVFKDDGYNVMFPDVPIDLGVRLDTSDEVHDHGYVVLTLRQDATARADYFSVPGDATPFEPGTPKLLFSETF